MERNTDREVLVYIQYTKLMEDGVSTDQVVDYLNRDEFNSLRTALGIGHVWFHTGQYLNLYSTNNKTLEWKDMEIDNISIWVLDDGKKQNYTPDVIRAMREIDPMVMDTLMNHYDILLSRYFNDNPGWNLDKDLYWYGLKLIETCMKDEEFNMSFYHECEKRFLDLLEQEPEDEEEWLFFKELVQWYQDTIISLLANMVNEG